MTLKETLNPQEGVTIYENTNQGKTSRMKNKKVSTMSVVEPVNYQVSKRGKPFQKMATND